MTFYALLPTLFITQKLFVMSGYFHSDPGPDKRGNSLLSVCGIFAGSAFFMLILSLGAYHYFYKGIPDQQQGLSVNKSLRGAISNFTTPRILDYVSQDGHMVFTYKMPKTGPVHIQVVDNTGDTVWQDEHIREEGHHGFEIPSDLFDSSVSYNIILTCRGKESQFSFSPS